MAPMSVPDNSLPIAPAPASATPDGAPQRVDFLRRMRITDMASARAAVRLASTLGFLAAGANLLLAVLLWSGFLAVPQPIAPGLVPLLQALPGALVLVAALCAVFAWRMRSAQAYPSALLLLVLVATDWLGLCGIFRVPGVVPTLMLIVFVKFLLDGVQGCWMFRSEPKSSVTR
jgi:UPF0716 family protein affecting phage T7 exclusion